MRMELTSILFRLLMFAKNATYVNNGKGKIMEKQDENSFIALAEVRGSKGSGYDGKLLFLLVAGPCGITILLKMK